MINSSLGLPICFGLSSGPSDALILHNPLAAVDGMSWNPAAIFRVVTLTLSRDATTAKTTPEAYKQ
jgi:hypothetical protein